MQNTEKKEGGEVKENNIAADIRKEITRIQEQGGEAFSKGDLVEVARLSKLVISLKADLARAIMPQTVRTIGEVQDVVSAMDKTELRRFILSQPKSEYTVFTGQYDNGKTRIDLKFSVFQSSKK